MRAIFFVAILLAATPLAAAGTAEAPEVVDPAGDAGPAGTAAPAHEDMDIVAAWIDNEQLDTFDLSIATAGASLSRPNSEVTQHIKVKGLDFYVGHISHEPYFSGPYVCQQGGDDFRCEDAVGGFQGAVLKLTVNKAFLDNATTGDAIEIVEGGSFALVGVFVPVGVGFMQGVPYDISPAGAPFVLAKGKLAAAADTAGAAANGTGLSATNTSLKPAGVDDADAQALNEAPLPLLVLAAAVAFALVVRRR